MFAIVPLAAEPLFSIGSLPVTNSLINAWVAVALFLVVAFVGTRRIRMTPSGFYNVIEAVVEFMLIEVEKVTSDRARAKKFLPFIGTIFLFVLLSNWMGLIPGVGSFGMWKEIHGELELVPLFRPATSDLNMTFAIAFSAIIFIHLTGLLTVGPLQHISRFINIRGVLLSLRKGPMSILVAVIEFFVGLLEIIGEFAKTLSLALRLFGNIFAGEVLIGVIMGIFSLFLPIPFIFLEILVGIIQATVFSMLTLAFLVMATISHGAHEEEHEGRRLT
ncbi:F0F1 ATP synthase subunit A [Candidatus Uhrbacteria bacterium]|nr:F0F1 ATP synthase subunit A [Candidatus Uhrbacteria bacterium]